MYHCPNCLKRYSRGSSLDRHFRSTGCHRPDGANTESFRVSAAGPAGSGSLPSLSSHDIDHGSSMSIAERMGINVDELSDGESDSNGPALHPPAPSPPFASTFADNNSDAMLDESATPSNKRSYFSFLFDDDPHASSDDETCLQILPTWEGSRATSAAGVRHALPPAHEPFDKCQSHSSVDEGDDGKEIKNPLQEESDTEGVESDCGEHNPSTITTAMQEEDMATESTDVGSLFLFSAPSVVLRNHERNPSFDDPALCPHTLKTIRDTYDLRGVNTKLNGKQVLPPIVISPNKLRETFRMRDPSESNVMVAAPPLDTVRRYLHLYGNKWTENTSAELVDLYMNTPKDSRGMINIGYATLSQAATGPYLQRLNPDAERRGIRVPAEKKVHRNFQKATRGREMLHHLNCGLQNLTELQLLLPKEVEDSLAFPSPEDVRAAIETSWRNNGLDIPEEPFPGLVHQSVTLGDNGASTRSPTVTSFHTDETNAGVLAKVYPDFHYLLTDNDDMLYVVNVETEDGNIQPCCFTQRQGTMVAFRAGNCDHGSVDKFTYLSTLTQEVGHSHSSKEALAGCRRHCDVASKPRVFCTAYTRFSLLDHAWELRAWEKAGVSPYYVVAGTTGNTRPKVPAASIKKVSDEHGLESPYMSEYKKPIYLEGRYAF